MDLGGQRIALFSGNYNYIKDGANNALNRLVGRLLDSGAAVRIYSPTSPTPAFPPTGDLVSVPSLPIPGRSEFRVALGLTRGTQADLEGFDPTLIHVSAPDWLGFGAVRFGRARNLPVFASLHTRFETYFSYYGLDFLARWAVSRQAAFYCSCDHVFVPNPASVSHLETLGVPRERISIWSRGVDSTHFAPTKRSLTFRRTLGYKDSELIIAFFGRLVREKGIEVFVRTIDELRKRGACVRPLIIGHGPAAGEFRQKVGEAVFLGHLQGKPLGRAVASSDILLNPSTTEAFGNVNLEAMASGLCVVSADAESAKAIISNGVDGLLCPPEPSMLADCVGDLIAKPELMRRVRLQAVESARSRRWTDVLDEVIGQYRRNAARAKDLTYA